MKKTIKVYKDLPFEVDKVYKTKFATGEHFTVKRIETNKQGLAIKLWGIYEKTPHLGECPIIPERLIADKEEIGTKDICDECGEPI